MGWADDLFEFGLTNIHGGVLKEHDDYSSKLGVLDDPNYVFIEKIIDDLREEYLKTPYSGHINKSKFSDDEIQILKKYGNWLEAITDNLIPLETGKLKRFYFSQTEACTDRTTLEDLWFRQNNELVPPYFREDWITSIYTWAREKNIPLIPDFDLVGEMRTGLPKDKTYLAEARRLNICGLRIEEIPNSFIQIRKIEHLDLQGNNITEIPDLIFELTQLKELDLSENSLSDIPKKIKNLKNLRRLDIYSNKFSDPQKIKVLTELWHIEQVYI